jgi:hypothetical protein
MRARSVVGIIAVFIALVTLFNFFYNNLDAFHTRDVFYSRLDRERRYRLGVPFTDRQHRIERQPRLERDDGAEFLNN